MSYFSDVEQDLTALLESGVNAPITFDFVYTSDSQKAVVINNFVVDYDNNFSLDNSRKTMTFSLGLVANSHDDLNDLIEEIDSLNGASNGHCQHFLINTITYGTYDQDTFTADMSCEVELYG